MRLLIEKVVGKLMRTISAILVFVCLYVGTIVAAEENPIASDAKRVKPLEVGDALPEIDLKTAEGEKVSLASFHKDGPLVVVFYRGSWCPFCTRHTQEIIKQYPEIRELGAELVAISPDSPAKVKESVQETKVPFPVLSDADVSAARAFGLAFKVDDATLKRYTGFGIDLEKASGHDHHALPVPAVFIADKEGKIRFRHHDANYRERLPATRIVEELRTLHGE
jgi:peroxiredoxin